MFVSFDKVSEQSALLKLDAHIRNNSEKSFSGKIVYELYDRNDNRVLSKETNLSVNYGKA